MLRYNRAIRSLTPELVISYIKEFSDYYKLPIISIGSGGAFIEHLAVEQHPTIKWICVDPKPAFTIYCKETGEDNVLIKPLFPTIFELSSKHPEYIDNCIIFLNWCNPNDSYYDYEAIEILKPKGVLAIYERFLGDNGAAGGIKFHKWLKEIFLREDKSYTIVAHTSEIDEECKDIIEPLFHKGNMITWFHSTKNDKTLNLQEKFPRQVEAKEKTECIVM